MRNGSFSENAAGLYWKHALWITAAVTLLMLLAENVFFVGIDVTQVALAVAFALVSSAVMAWMIGRLTKSDSPKPIQSFLTFASLKLAAAVVLIAGYMITTGLRGSKLLPFAVTLTVYFLLLDALDAFYMVKVQRMIQKQ